MRLADRVFDTEREQKMRRTSGRLWILMTGMIGALIILAGLRSGIGGGVVATDLAAIARGQGNAGSAIAGSAYKVVRWALLGTAVVAIAYAAPVHVGRSRKATLFWLGATATSVILFLSTFLGSGSSFRLNLFDLAVVLVAFWALPTPPYREVLRQVQGVLLVIGYASILYFIFHRDGAAQEYTGGLVEALPFRLHGVTIHANVLGSLVGLWLVLEASNSRPGAMKWLNRGVMVSTLALTQSKTTIGIVLAIVLVSAVTSSTGWQRRGWAPRLLVGGSGVAVGLWIALSDGNPLSRDIASGSFTGRDVVWRETMKVWELNPLFGYGPDLWDLPMRLRYLGILPNPPAHAHSQWYQILGAYGIVGMIAFGLMVLGFARLAIAGRSVSQGASLGVLLLLVGRSITEPVWLPENLASTSASLLGVLVVLAAAANTTPTESHDDDESRHRETLPGATQSPAAAPAR